MIAQIAKKPLLVFISHAGEDNAAARRLYKRLKDDGFAPWLDEECLLPGQNWGLEIEKALLASDVILICFSSSSIIKEGYVQREYKRAMNILMEKPEGMIFVIPVRLDDCQMPHFIRELQWVDYPSDYDKLLRALQVKMGVNVAPQKSEPKKGRKTRKAVTPKSNGPIFNIHGSVNISGDMIAGNQFNYSEGKGDIKDISTPMQFVDNLRFLEEEIKRMNSQSEISAIIKRRLDLLQFDIQNALDEAHKERPSAKRMILALDNAKESMDILSGSIAGAVNLAATIGNLRLMAWKIFGD